MTGLLLISNGATRESSTEETPQATWRSPPGRRTRTDQSVAGVEEALVGARLVEEIEGREPGRGCNGVPVQGARTSE